VLCRARPVPTRCRVGAAKLSIRYDGMMLVCGSMVLRAESMPHCWGVDLSIFHVRGFVTCLTGRAWAFLLLVSACDATRLGSMTNGSCARALCTKGRVSGVWLVWARWIPARAATTSHSCLFNCWFILSWPILVSCVAYLSRRQLIDKTMSLSILCHAPRGCGVGWTSKRSSCTACRVLENVLR
jgi:hypothetical protein